MWSRSWAQKVKAESPGRKEQIKTKHFKRAYYYGCANLQITGTIKRVPTFENQVEKLHGDPGGISGRPSGRTDLIMIVTPPWDNKGCGGTQFMGPNIFPLIFPFNLTLIHHFADGRTRAGPFRGP